ncbi:MAG TPA: complex I subunit 1 family protein [Thermoplasmata archaeon]|nr:complex I subunit 1 family protein [Thermoplasmata archaeon]
MSGALIDLWGWSQALATFILWLSALPIELGNTIAMMTGAPAPGPLTGLIGFVRSEGLTSLVAVIIATNIVLLWATAFHLLIIMWIERKMYSRLQDRRGIMLGLGSSDILRKFLGPIPLIGRLFRRPSHLGTGFLQTVADGVKLFQKEVITPATADKWMFHAAPVIISASTLMLFVAIPWSDGFWLMGSVVNGQPVNPWGILVILAAFSVAPLGILIAGWASNNKYTLLGGMRAAAQLMSYEIPMVLAIIALVIYTGTLDPFVLVRQQELPLSWGLGPYGPLTVSWIPDWNIFNPVLWIAFIVFFITVIAEAERIPFDIPEAEAELVEGWTTEYSGMRFGIVFGFKWLRAIAGAALIAILFLGGWSGPVFATIAAPNITSPAAGPYPIPILPQEFWFTVKIYLIFIVFVWIGWSVPRVRIDQILNIGWKQLVPLSVFSILLAALARGLRWF